MCYRSADPNTYKANKWMVEFLLQHSSPIDEKISSSLGDTFPTLLNYDRGRYANDALSVLRQCVMYKGGNRTELRARGSLTVSQHHDDGRST
jgi:hypothetical protein